MKIQSIKFEQLLPTGNFLNARYGIEISISEDTEIDRAFELAKQIATDTHKKQFPAMYKDNKPIYQGEEAEPVIQQKKPTGMDKWIDEINKCTTIPKPDGLESLRTIADTSPKLKEVFLNKLKQLQDEQH